MSVLSQPHFHDEAKAFEYLESMVWADGIVCPHCGVVGGRVYDLAGVRAKPSKKNPEGAVRHGLKKCGECRKQFTVKVGTVFEACHAAAAQDASGRSPDDVAARRASAPTSCTASLRSPTRRAWFLSHRIREAMRSGDLAPFGAGGGIVEVDETYIGREQGRCRSRRGVRPQDEGAGAGRPRHRPGPHRSSSTTSAPTTLMPIVRANIATRSPPDDRRSARLYRDIGKPLRRPWHDEPQRRRVRRSRTDDPHATRSKAASRSSSAA